MPDIDYPFRDNTIVVTHCGRIFLGLNKINFSTVFAGQAVGIKVVHEDTENFNSRREMLGIDGLSNFVRDASGLPLAEVKQQILNRVTAWRDGPAADDVSLVAVEVSWACKETRVDVKPLLRDAPRPSPEVGGDSCDQNRLVAGTSRL